MEVLLQKIRRSDNQSGFEDVEALLRATLTPVNPRQVYVKDLKTRIVHHQPSGLKIERPGNPHNLLFMFASIASSALLIITGIRMLLTLVALFGGMRQIRRQTPRKTLPSTPVV